MTDLDCTCGHDLVWHHENRGCGYHGYGPGRCQCRLRFDDAHVAIVQRAVTEALTEAAAEVVDRGCIHDGCRACSAGRSAHRAAAIVRARIPN